jgi:hypothetical protein
VIYCDKGTQGSKTVVFGTRLECLTKATELLLIGFLRSSALPCPATWSIRDGAWGVLSEVQTLVCRKNIHDLAYLSIGVTSGIGAGLCRVPGDGCFQGYRGEAMQDLGYEIPRNPIPRTRVNKGIDKGRDC